MKNHSTLNTRTRRDNRLKNLSQRNVFLSPQARPSNLDLILRKINSASGPEDKKHDDQNQELFASKQNLSKCSPSIESQSSLVRSTRFRHDPALLQRVVSIMQKIPSLDSVTSSPSNKNKWVANRGAHHSRMQES